MPYTINSANMSLPIPVVGQDPGPQYASDLNNCLTIIDQHNHSAGSGVQITPSGLNINADLPINSNNLTLLRSIRFNSQNSPLALAADVQSIYVSGVDLYYNNSLGTQIRLTQNGAVAGTPGSIANLVSPASAAYVSGSSTFVWQSAALTPANLDAASIVLRNLTASSFGLTLSPPNAMGSNTTITLPTLPASQSLVEIDSSGNMSASVAHYQALNPPGAIIMFGGASSPVGYLLCDGSLVSRTTYAALFSAIGEAYGSGDGSTTFALPDFRGMFPRGVDNGRGIDPEAGVRSASAAGGNTGDNVGSFESFATQYHVHQVAAPAGATYLQGSGPFPAGGGSGGSNGGLGTTVNQTGNLSAETRPINIYVNFIIKT